MYQIYRNPTQYPLKQGEFVLRDRANHDKQMKRNFSDLHSRIDTATPSNFPLRHSHPHTQGPNSKKIRLDNERLIKNIMKTRCDPSTDWKGDHLRTIVQTRKYHDRKREMDIKLKTQKIERENKVLSDHLRSVKSDYSPASYKEHNERQMMFKTRKKKLNRNDMFLAPGFRDKRRKKLRQKRSKTQKKPLHVSFGDDEGET